MNIILTDEQTDIAIPKKQVEKIVEEVIHFEGKEYDEVSLNFVSTEEICALHDEFFDDPTPTDCISFPMNNEDLPFPGIRILGDVFVCPKTAIEYANEHQLNVYEEITLYIVHGLLHLMGYDDISDEDQLIMRNAERRHMSHLREKNLYLK